MQDRLGCRVTVVRPWVSCDGGCGRPELWDQEDASNFAISLWYKPRPTKSCDKKTVHSLVYKVTYMRV